MKRPRYNKQQWLIIAEVKGEHTGSGSKNRQRVTATPRGLNYKPIVLRLEASN